MCLPHSLPLPWSHLTLPDTRALLTDFPGARSIIKQAAGRSLLPPFPQYPVKMKKPNQVPLPFFCCAGVGDRELAEDTGLARSAYMSSESALRTELLLEEALETEETLLTLRDLERANNPLQSQTQREPGSDEAGSFVLTPPVYPKREAAMSESSCGGQHPGERQRLCLLGHS